MASTGSRLNSHGFAFLWRDNWEMSLAPYSITAINFAPFQTVERFLHVEDGSLPGLFDQLCAIIKEYTPEGTVKLFLQYLTLQTHSYKPFVLLLMKDSYIGGTTELRSMNVPI